MSIKCGILLQQLRNFGFFQFKSAPWAELRSQFKSQCFLIRVYLSGPDSVETCLVLETSTGVLNDDEVDYSEHPGSNILV